MVKETDVQKEVVLNYITDKVNGLGYNEVSANTISNNLIIEKDFINFLKSSQNIKNYNKVLKDYYSGNEKKFQKDIISQVHDDAYSKRNVALFFGKKTFIFKEHSFVIYNTSESVLKGNELFEENIFSVCEELTYKSNDLFKKNEKVYNRRPDLVFFLNGIFFSYCELKFINNGQSAKDHGRDKVISNYSEAIKDFFLPNIDKLSINERKECARNSFLKLFEKPIHITTSDLRETYVIRNISNYYKSIDTKFRNKEYNMEDIYELIKKDFKIYPSEQKGDQILKMKETFYNIYSKKSIENEILYYNYIQYQEDKKGSADKGRKKNISNQGILISPRPKQKYGVDKTIDRIKILYEHEKNPNYIIEEFSSLIKHLPKESITEEIENRKELNKNQKIFSILLQYAAGFGKTNIMCWLALQLKDLIKDDSFLFDKILLVSDRVDLRTQVKDTMGNMNIEKSLIVEAEKGNFYEHLLNKKTRIIVVNIQKFNPINEKLSKKEKEILSQSRVAFIIDEIHRSNSGIQNEKMTNLFEELSDKLSDIDSKKKNTVIGLTATPSEHVLRRFGEFKGYIDKGGLWQPFDSYTMEEAIADGFVLDPLKGVVSENPSVVYDIPHPDDKKNSLPSKKEIYNNPERIDIISRHIVKMLINNTFRQIRNNGKGMLACDSIKAALIYFDQINKYLKEEYALLNIEEEKRGKVYIVYTKPSEQKFPTSESLNNGMSEELTISEFKAHKNALIIVVDKLQTGFDEPSLHTLFLDKEIKDINAVQTVCRVNRTRKFKENCLIIDFSIDGINKTNIKEAFEKYAGLTSAYLSNVSVNNIIDSIYKEIKINDIYKRNYELFEQSINDTHKAIIFENKIKNIDKEKVNEFLLIGSNFKIKLTEFFDVINLKKEYLNPKLMKFFKTIRNVITKGNQKEEKYYVDFEILDDLSPWENIIEDIEEIAPTNSNSSNNKEMKAQGEKKEIDVINEILKAQEYAAMKEEALAQFKERVDNLFEDLLQNKRFYNKTTSNKSTYEELHIDFIKEWKKIKRRELSLIKKKQESKYTEFFFLTFEILKDYYFQEYLKSIN